MISAIGGTAGIGKTTLAVHWAHLVADRFPDGQLYLNLRGFDPVAPPMTAAAAVRGFLEAFRVPPDGLPTTLDAQVALYRSLVADKRVLVVLDNAADAAQVRPLLPGTPRCLVLVTSRHRLSSLVAVEGAHPLTLDVLSTGEAHDQLAGRLGPERVMGEPRAVKEIIECCGGLPLALAVVAARAGEHPAFPLSAVADELREAAGRLDALDNGDPATNVRAVLSLSYEQLSAPAARLFRLLGLHAGPDITVPAAASLAGLPGTAVRALLAELARSHLVSEHVPGRFSCHDLLRVYAIEQADRRDPVADRNDAVHRVLDHYAHTVRGAALLLAPYREAPALLAPRAGVVPEEVADRAAAMRWYTAERATLQAAVRQAETAGLDAHTCQLAWSLAIFFQRRGHWHDWAATAHNAINAARRGGDRHRQAHAHRDLARACIPMGDFDEARRQLTLALDLFGDLDDAGGQGQTLINLGILFERQGRHEEALRHTRQALDRFRLTGNQLMQARSCNAIGWLSAKLGRYQDALDWCQPALVALQGLDDIFGQARHLGQPRLHPPTPRRPPAGCRLLRTGSGAAPAVGRPDRRGHRPDAPGRRAPVGRCPGVRPRRLATGPDHPGTARRTRGGPAARQAAAARRRGGPTTDVSHAGQRRAGSGGKLGHGPATGGRLDRGVRARVAHAGHRGARGARFDDDGRCRSFEEWPFSPAS